MSDFLFYKKLWDGLIDQFNLSDFAPASQYVAAVKIVMELKAITLLLPGNTKSVMQKASAQWVVFGSTPADKLIAKYNQYLL